MMILSVMGVLFSFVLVYAGWSEDDRVTVGLGVIGIAAIAVLNVID